MRFFSLSSCGISPVALSVHAASRDLGNGDSPFFSFFLLSSLFFPGTHSERKFLALSVVGHGRIKGKRGDVTLFLQVFVSFSEKRLNEEIEISLGNL